MIDIAVASALALGVGVLLGRRAKLIGFSAELDATDAHRPASVTKNLSDKTFSIDWLSIVSGTLLVALLAIGATLVILEFTSFTRALTFLSLPTFCSAWMLVNCLCLTKLEQNLPDQSKRL